MMYIAKPRKKSRRGSRGRRGGDVTPCDGSIAEFKVPAGEGFITSTAVKCEQNLNSNSWYPTQQTGPRLRAQRPYEHQNGAVVVDN